MELKKFISTLKGFRTRFSKKPNAELERKSVESLVEKFGGKLEAIATLKEQGLDDLKDYIKGIFGILIRKEEPAEEKPTEVTPAAPTTSETKVETSSESAPKTEEREILHPFIGKDEEEYARKKNGALYKIDRVKKTMTRVLNDFRQLADVDFSALDEQMPMTTYQRYLRDNFPGEDCPIKKGKLHFRGYRISCDIESGFVIEDTQKRYEVVETPFEGIPTPRELGEWFKRPKREFTPEEIAAAIERGKEHERQRKEEREAKMKAKQEAEEVDYEKLRKKVLRMIEDARSKTIDVDPMKIPEVIPFKRWRRKVNSLLTQWKKREIRYPKLLRLIEEATVEETFVVEEKNHRSSFTGTILPEHEKVGLLVGDKIEVDGKWIDAVPFLLDYLLFYEKRAMAQIMKYAHGEITDVELIKNPLEQDWKVEFSKRALENTAHNAQVLCMVYAQVGIVAPQDLLYEADLEAGDRILLDVDGELKTHTVASTEKGITLGKEVGLLKLDKWIKLPKKEDKLTK